MTLTHGAVVTVVQPGGGDSVPIPGFGAVFKLTSQTPADTWRSSSIRSRSA